jgi:hypothetical protein
MQTSLVASLAQLIIGCSILKFGVLLDQACMASAICKQLKKKPGGIDLSSRVSAK